MTNLNKSEMEIFDEKLKELNTKGGFLYDVGEEYEAVDFDVDAIKQWILAHDKRLRDATVPEEKTKYLTGYEPVEVSRVRLISWNQCRTESLKLWDRFIN